MKLYATWRRGIAVKGVGIKGILLRTGFGCLLLPVRIHLQLGVKGPGGAWRGAVWIESGVNLEV